MQALDVLGVEQGKFCVKILINSRKMWMLKSKLTIFIFS